MPTGRHLRRTLFVATVASTLIVTSAGPTLAATDHPVNISWSGVWNWLTDRHPTLAVPAQQTGTARSLPHEVPARTTRARRGTGRPPGKGRGQLPPFRLHGPTARTTKTKPFTGNASRSFNPSTSTPVMSRATATSTLYRNRDGSYSRLVYSAPVNYRSANGTWQPIKTALERTPSGRLRETSNSLGISLAPVASSSNLVSVSFTPSERASYSLLGAAQSPASLSGGGSGSPAPGSGGGSGSPAPGSGSPAPGSGSPGSASGSGGSAVHANSAIYRNVFPHTDLRLSAIASGLDEALILHSPNAPSTWTFPLTLTGLTPRIAKNGGIDLINSAGATAAEIPPAYMYDSSFARRSGNHATSTAVTYHLTTAGGKPAITMSASKSWLDDPHRVYPVTVDPNFTASGTTYVMYPDTVDDSVYNDLLVGTWDNGGQIGNSFLAFSGLGTALAGDHISSATLEMFDMEAATCTPEPFSVAAVTQSWSVTGSKSYPGPSHGAQIGTVTDAPGAACTNTSLDTTVGTWMGVALSTATFNSWTTGGTNNGLEVYAATTGNLSWKRFDSDNSQNPPYLMLNYTPDVAPQISSQYPPDNFQSPTLTPELIASGTDSDNWPTSPVKYVFTVYTTSGTQVATSGLVSTGDWVVPAGKLSWGPTYYWTVQDYDGFDYSSTVNAHYFTTQVPQPLLTSGLAQNSDGHGFDQSVGNYTTSATDANVQTAGPSLSVVRDYNSLDPRSSGAFGAGWSTQYDMKATEVDNASGGITSVVITYPDGSEVGFGDSNGTFTPPLGRFATLTALPNHGGYTLTDKTDTTYTFSQATSSGVFAISSITNYLGNTETFGYTGGQLTTATSGVSGRSLHFTWSTPTGAQFAHVASVSTDPATAGQPSTALTWNYSYTGDQLTSVCPPTSPASCTSYGYTTGTHFPTAVLDTGPAAYWRLGEGSGGTAVDSVLANEGVFNGTYSGVTLGQPGPLPGSSATSAQFNGTSSYMQLPSSLAGNASYLAGGYLTVSLWFKTTATGGVLFGSSSNPISGGTTTGAYVPSLYVGSDGKLNGELWGTSTPIASTASVADGHWHYAVVTAAGSTESLYLDGSLVGSQSTQVGVTGQPYVYVGAGYIGGNWPDESHHLQSGTTGYASYFSGSISDVALYSQYLTAPTVAGLYATGNSAAGLLNQVTAPSGNTRAQVSYDTVTDRVTSVTDAKGGTWTLSKPAIAGSSQVYRSAVLGANPAGYWRLGDSGTPAQAADEVLGGPASFSSVTLGTAGPFADEAAATFNGTSSYLQLPSTDVPATGPDTIGLWFKVPGGNTAGGVLYDYESNPLNYPGQPTGNWVPALYVGTDGKLRGEFWNGSVAPITSASAVNDGQWHYAVLAGGSTGQSLYLDGSLVGTSATAIKSSPTNDVYVGAGVTAANWPSHSANLVSYFTGSIAEVAFYRSQLNAAQVLTQWEAAKSSSGLSPTETITVTDPGGHPMAYSYDPMEGDRQLSETDALGNRTTYGYDTSGFQDTTTEPDGNVITTGHDLRGNLVSQTTCQNQAANQCSTEYYTYYPDDTTPSPPTDPRNDLVTTIRDGRSSSATDNRYLTTYTYNAAGDQTSATTPPVAGFPNGRTTTMTYTTATTSAVGGGVAPAGLLAATTTPGGATETIGYYSDGDVATVTDPAGEATTYTYDVLGRVLTKTVVSGTYPSGLVTSYAYNGAGQVLTESDPPVTDHVTGAVHTARTTNAYDTDGNLTSVTVADLTGGDASRTTSYAFNSHDEMASKTDALGNKTTFGYDAYGNQTSQTDANGSTTSYAYDADGHLLTVTLDGYTGDPASPTAATNLVEQSRAYDPDGRLASITDSMGRQTSYAYTDNGLTATVTKSNQAAGQSFIEQSNFYDAAGNLIKRLTSNGTSTVTYNVDAADRTTSTTLDPAGLNRTTTTSFSPDDFVLNTTVSGASGPVSQTDHTYDSLGRLTSTTVHDDSSGHSVGWWPLAGGSPAYAADSSGGGNAEFPTTGATLSSGSASFNGTSGLLATAGPVLNTAQSYSVSAWVNLASNTPGDVVSQGGTNIGSFALQYSSGFGGWSFTSPSADSATHTVSSAHLSTAPATGVWTHLVGVFNASSGAMSLYLNGALAATGTNSTPFSGSGPLTIGGDQQAGGTQSAFFKGQIAGVQVYQRALSATDVATLYTGGRSGGVIGSNAHTTTWTLDQRGLPTSMTDPNGNTTNYNYDEAGKLAVVSSPAVSTEISGGSPVQVRPITSYGYDTFGEQVTSEDPDGNITTTNYDADGRQLAVTQPPYTPPGASTPITATTTRTYDGIGEPTSVTDALGNTTSYAYDQLGDVATVTQPGGGVTHSTFDTDGEQLSATNPVGAQSQATYDYLSRQVTATQIVRQPSPAAYTTTSSYADAAGYLSSTTSPAGVTTSYGYDAAGEVTSAIDGAGDTTTYSYDTLGRQIVATMPDGTSQHTSFDEAGNVVGVSDDGSSGSVLSQTSASYDADGKPISTTDPMGNTTTVSYNALGLPVTSVQPVSATSSITTSLGYDPAGNLTRYTDGNGNATTYTYNSWNQGESTIVPATAANPGLASRTFTVSYDADGRLAQQTSPGGVTVTNSYDAFGDLTGQTGSGADAPTTARTFGYNPIGEVTSATAPGGTDTFSYDDRGLILSAAGPSGASSFGYNVGGQLATQTTAAGTSSFTYDSAGRPATLTDAVTGDTLSYGYNADSELTSIGYGSSGAASQALTYNGLHELTGDTLTAPSGQAEAAITYGYNADGDETSKTTTGVDGASSNTYAYDDANRLSSWNNGATTVTYGYDADGNRTGVGSQTFTYDARDELLSGGGSTYAYTPRGTLASLTSGGTATSSAFDAFNELISQGSQHYGYDALGRVVSGPGTTFAYAGASNQVASDGAYTYSRDVSGNLVGIGIGAGSVLALTDQHRDVVGEFTASGSALTGSASYDPLGNVIASAGAVGNLGYQSGWTDTGTGNVNMDSRWYNPASGQFLSRDSASNSALPNPAAANPFAYGDDNPMTAYDPMGTCDWWNPLCGAQQKIQQATTAVSNAWNGATSAVGNAVGNAWNGATSTLGSWAGNITQGFGSFMASAQKGLTNLATSAVHVFTSVVTTVKDAYHNVTTTISNAAHTVVKAAATAVVATYHAVKYAVNTATQFVQHHAAAIVSFVASTAVFMGCEAALGVETGGVGAVVAASGCSALAGAVGNVVTYAMTTPRNKWSLGGFAATAAQGAAIGAVSGVAGELGSALLGPVIDAIGSRLGPALVDDVAGAADNAADGALDGAAADVGNSAETSATDATATVDSGNANAGANDPSTNDPAGDAQTPKDNATSCPANSFTGATRVLLASGRRVALDKLRTGQRVRAADPYTGTTGARRILHVIRHTGLHAMVAITLLGGSVIHATAHHLLWDASAGRFAWASTLKAGDKLAEPGGRLVAVSKTRDYRENLTAWNLAISGIHTYYVLAGQTAVLVHNDCPPGDDAGSASQSGDQASSGDASASGPTKPDGIGNQGPPKVGQKVYRVWGKDPARPSVGMSGPWGHSWTRIAPEGLENYRFWAGLPNDANMGRFVSVGILEDVEGAWSRDALKIGDNLGGLDEVMVNDPEHQIRLLGVFGVTPEL
jgi:RHS repeat-associated protein